MPRIAEFYGIAIYTYFRDHAPPHFHAIYGRTTRRSRSRLAKYSRGSFRGGPRASCGNGGRNTSASLKTTGTWHGLTSP